MADPTPKDRPLRVIHLCYADAAGGAAIGARRSHQAMLKHGIDSRLVVVLKSTNDQRVLALPRKRVRRFLARRSMWLINKLRIIELQFIYKDLIFLTDVLTIHRNHEQQ